VEGKNQLEVAREALRYLCEPVAQPREMEQYLHYFCGDASNAGALAETEPLRISFYKATATLLRAYADIATNLTVAGYSDAEIAALAKEMTFYADTRAALKKHSAEELDIKPYEADMRHLINTYIQADAASAIGTIEQYSLVELIIETGIHDAIAQKLNQQGKLSNHAIAEGIINNVRKTIIRDQLTDPRFYEEMSKLLDDLIKQDRADTADYEKFLAQAEALVKGMGQKDGSAGTPAALHGKPEATVVYNNLPRILAAVLPQVYGVAEAAVSYGDSVVELALKIDRVMHEEAPAGWKLDTAGPKGSQVLNALFLIMSRDREATEAIFEIVKNQPGY